MGPIEVEFFLIDSLLCSFTVAKRFLTRRWLIFATLGGERPELGRPLPREPVALLNIVEISVDVVRAELPELPGRLPEIRWILLQGGHSFCNVAG
jgi:hypothetical protein